MLLRCVTVNLMLIFVRVRLFASIIRLLVIKHGRRRPSNRTCTFRLVMMYVSRLRSNVNPFTRNSYQIRFFLRNLRVNFGTQRIRCMTARTLTCYHRCNVTCPICLTNLIPRTICRRRTIKRTCLNISLRGNEYPRRASSFLPAAIKRMRYRERK